MCAVSASLTTSRKKSETTAEIQIKNNDDILEESDLFDRSMVFFSGGDRNRLVFCWCHTTLCSHFFRRFTSNMSKLINHDVQWFARNVCKFQCIQTIT